MVAMPHHTRDRPALRPGHGFAVHERPPVRVVPEDQAGIDQEEEPFVPLCPVFFDAPPNLGGRIRLGVVPSGKYLDVVIRTIGDQGEVAGDYSDAFLTAEEWFGFIEHAGDVLAALPAMSTPGAASQNAPLQYGCTG